MCNDYGNHVPYAAYVDAFAQLELPLVSPMPGAAPNLEPRDEIWPTELAPVIRSAEGGVELTQIRWGLAPSRPKARAVINLRSERRKFTGGRCLVPASHYYEFTGTGSPKTRWRITRAAEDWFCFAGLIGHVDTVDGDAEAYALLTSAPGPDVAPYHNRQPVILDRSHWAAWMDPSVPASDLLRPSPAGTLKVIEAPRG